MCGSYKTNFKLEINKVWVYVIRFLPLYLIIVLPTHKRPERCHVFKLPHTQNQSPSFPRRRAFFVCFNVS